jgi:hypothetical protein
MTEKERPATALKVEAYYQPPAVGATAWDGEATVSVVPLLLRPNGCMRAEPFT